MFVFFRSNKIEYTCRCLLVMLGALVLLIGSASKAGDIQPPFYVIHRTWGKPDALVGGLLVISPKDAIEPKLIALGKALREKYKSCSILMFQVFTDERAAILRDVPMAQQSQDDKNFFDAHYVADYSKNDKTVLDEIEVMPKGLNGPVKTIRLGK